MLDLILIIMLIVSIFKPDVLLGKRLKERANENEKKIVIKDVRLMFISVIIICEMSALYFNNNTFVFFLITMATFIYALVLLIPSARECRKITKQYK